jgi:zinc transporter ZupT
MHRLATVVLSSALGLLGVAMAATAVARGGGPLSYGVVLGVLLAAAGGARLWLATRGDGPG